MSETRLRYQGGNMFGLSQIGQNTKSQALNGLNQAAQSENDRNLGNRQIVQQQKQADNQLKGAGASLGAALGGGAAASAGLGTASIIASGLASGGIGLLGGYLLTEIF